MPNIASLLPLRQYRIAGNFGEVFNLAIWRILKKIAKLKTRQYLNNRIFMT